MLESKSKACIWVKAVADTIAEQVISKSGKICFPGGSYPEDAVEEIIGILCRVPEILNVEIQEGTNTLILTLEKGAIL